MKKIIKHYPMTDQLIVRRGYNNDMYYSDRNLPKAFILKKLIRNRLTINCLYLYIFGYTLFDPFGPLFSMMDFLSEKKTL